MLSAKEINKLAIPAILFNITEPLISLADIAIIGQISDGATEAQGGVGLAAGLIATLVWGFAQMRTSLSAIISLNLTDIIYYRIPYAIKSWNLISYQY